MGRASPATAWGPEMWRVATAVPASESGATGGSLHVLARNHSTARPEIRRRSVPQRRSGVGIDHDPAVLEPLHQRFERVDRLAGRSGSLGNQSSERRAELDLARGETFQLKALLVHESMMEAAEEERVVEAGFPSVGPVLRRDGRRSATGRSPGSGSRRRDRPGRGAGRGRSCASCGRRRGWSRRARGS